MIERNVVNYLLFFKSMKKTLATLEPENATSVMNMTIKTFGRILQNVCIFDYFCGNKKLFK
jgi:hypothetical protein